ncbi:ATP-binding cassette domain-containing protein [Streptococcus orisasini]|uniref:ATP-binding cassette domain-containing protein n=1 Tax=Streptococcus orisasini TaxID=1080071 RepID=UPI0007097171|nr:ATP-binding cassette domain-containing protein [Streptococcus orisasini]
MEISISNFSKKFRNKQVFIKQSLKLNLNDKKITFITGENGSGKTTLMKIIAGILFVSSGTFEKISGLDYFSWSKENCYYVSSTERGLTYKLTGVENIIALCSLKGSSKDEILDKLKRYAPLFDAEKILNKRIEELSTGQKRKIHILSAFCSPSKVLLLDEPSIGLDDHNLELLIKNIKYFNVSGNKKIIIISHENLLKEKLMEEEIHIDSDNRISSRNRSVL